MLYALRRRGEATAEQVADQLGMTVSGARQHLTALDPSRTRRRHRDAVDRAQARSTHARVLGDRRGRRATSRRPTASSPTSCSATSPTPTPSCSTTLFAKRRQHRIENAQTRLAGKRTLGTKVAELTRILDEDGYLATYEKVAPGVYRVIEHNCAIWAVAQRYGQACTSEIDFIRASLPEAEIERVQHMVAGARHCAYEIRARAAA